MVRFSVEEVLAEVHDRQVAMVRQFGEYVGDETVGGQHEIVEDEETGLAKMASVFAGRPLLK